MLFSEQIPNPQRCPDGRVNACSVMQACAHTLISGILLSTEHFSEQKFAFTNIWRMEIKKVLHAVEADSWFLFKLL